DAAAWLKAAIVRSRCTTTIGTSTLSRMLVRSTVSPRVPAPSPPTRRPVQRVRYASGRSVTARRLKPRTVRRCVAGPDRQEPDEPDAMQGAAPLSAAFRRLADTQRAADLQEHRPLLRRPPLEGHQRRPGRAE